MLFTVRSTGLLLMPLLVLVLLELFLCSTVGTGVACCVFGMAGNAESSLLRSRNETRLLSAACWSFTVYISSVTSVMVVFSTKSDDNEDFSS